MMDWHESGDFECFSASFTQEDNPAAGLGPLRERLSASMLAARTPLTEKEIFEYGVRKAPL